MPFCNLDLKLVERGGGGPWLVELWGGMEAPDPYWADKFKVARCSYSDFKHCRAPADLRYSAAQPLQISYQDVEGS